MSEMTFDPKELVLVRAIDVTGVIDWLLHPGSEHFRVEHVDRVTRRATKLFEEMTQAMEPLDELWLCRSAAYEPSALLGHEGLAVVRAGTITEYRLVLQY